MKKSRIYTISTAFAIIIASCIFPVTCHPSFEREGATITTIDYYAGRNSTPSEENRATSLSGKDSEEFIAHLQAASRLRVPAKVPILSGVIRIHYSDGNQTNVYVLGDVIRKEGSGQFLLQNDPFLKEFFSRYQKQPITR